MRLRILIISTLFFTSCASKVVTVKPQGLVPLKDFAKITYVSSHDFVLKVGEFSDKREVTDSVGIAHTGIRDERTPLVLDSSLTDFVAKEIESGLEKRGILVSNNASYVLSGEIKDFWITESVGSILSEQTHCNVRLGLQLAPEDTSLKGVKRWSGNLHVKATSRATIADTTGLNGNMMVSCMNLIVEKLIRDTKFQNLVNIRLINK